MQWTERMHKACSKRMLAWKSGSTELELDSVYEYTSYLRFKEQNVANNYYILDLQRIGWID